MATQDHTVDGTEITPAPWTLPDKTPRDISKSDTESQRQTVARQDANSHDERLLFSKLFAQSLDMRAEEGRVLYLVEIPWRCVPGM
ncbi:hypothetical protein [Saliniramus fredricksonii]|uniref:hypothetical protein n=1 Tax=Saliniramus fredricksonii TaxID=1653334 RepID=UPI0010426254|nr:hypothetical protein [Saliniramus fredricksonii]